MEKYGVDAVRYYLTREVNFGSDGSFSPEQFVERINADLANSYGNLLNRTIGMMSKYFGGTIPEYKGQVTEFDGSLESVIKTTIANYENAMDDLRITEAITYVNELVNIMKKVNDVFSIKNDKGENMFIRFTNYEEVINEFKEGMKDYE